ncbi:MAG TPA: hypothetical protein VJ891_16465 [Casimicrobiaceae bacterium]|nr:hypothetical protein [Casimicrobiaceae bacterium]
MKRSIAATRRISTPARLALSIACAGALLLSVTNSAVGDPKKDVPWTGPVPRAQCSPGDNTETGLQGQTTLAERLGGSAAQGLNCNLQLVGQSQGEGAYHAQTWTDVCSYYSTADSPLQQHPGVAVIDASDPTHPTPTAYLSAPAFLQTWESLKISEERKLLAAVESENGAGIHPGFAVYDVSDCRHPVLQSAIDLPLTQGPIKGHAGAISPDGRTYYGSYFPVSLYIVDMADPTNPKLMLNWVPPGGIGAPHDLSISDDNTRAYIMNPATGASHQNGLVVVDVSDFHFRRANAQPRVIRTLFWSDGGIAMTSQPIRIRGKHYILASDELGPTLTNHASACAQGLPPWGFPRLIDIEDEKNPKTVALLKLEIDDPANCDALANDPAMTGSFGYSAHYCHADDPNNTKLVACSRHEAGVRVFDVSDPYHPKEVAYYKPPVRSGNNLPGSGINAIANHTFDWSKSNSRFIKQKGARYLWITSADNGFQVLRFEKNDDD